MACILIVDEDRSIRQKVEAAATEEGYLCRFTDRFDGIVPACNEYLPDVVVMAWGLTGHTGAEICDTLRLNRSITKIPYILVTSPRDDESFRIRVYQSGCDDLLQRPFSSIELLVRIHALLRRSQFPRDSREIKTGHLRLDRVRKKLKVLNSEGLLVPCQLTSTEFLFVQTFMSGIQGQVWTRSALLAAACGRDQDLLTVDERVVDGSIKRIRNKLRQSGLQEDVIQTHFGLGYSFCDPTTPMEAGKASHVIQEMPMSMVY